MSARTVDWTALRAPGPKLSEAQGLRERKKREMRQLLSDTATEMFIERGFDAVRVAEVAEACGVSEKTVYNYFPSKESLLLDRWDATMASIRVDLADPAVSPIDATLRILDQELHALTSWLARQDDTVAAASQVQRFGTLITTTPALRAHQHEVTDNLVAAAAEVLARRSRMKPDDPEPHIAATALLGLWQVQFRSLGKHLNGIETPAQIHRAVTSEVERAARLLETGLNSLGRVDTRRRRVTS